MDRKKSPQEKKIQSYSKDRRNTYQQNMKAARIAIPRRKRQNNRKLRKRANQLLQPGSFDLESSEDKTKSVARLLNLSRWRKCPDIELKYFVFLQKRVRTQLKGLSFEKMKIQPHFFGINRGTWFFYIIDLNNESCQN